MIVLPLEMFQISIHKFLDYLIFDRFLHRGVRNCFFPILFIYFPYPIWTFISLFYLDFYFLCCWPSTSRMPIRPGVFPIRLAFVS